MSVEDFKGNIWKYYIFHIMYGFWFIIPIGILYLQAFDMTYKQIAVFEFVNAAVIIFLEIPTGVFADLIGKKWSTFIGCLFWSGALFTIGFGSVFGLFLTGYLLWGFGDAFLSGSSQALLYDSLKKIKKEKQFLKVKGKLLFIGAIALIIGSLSGGYLYKWNIRLPWILYGLALLIAAIVIMFIKEPYISKMKYNFKNQYNHMKDSIKYSFTHVEIRWLIIFYILASLPLAIFVNIAEQPYLIQIGFSVVSLGIIFAITRSLVGLLSTFIFKIEQKLGERLSFFLVTFIYSGVFVLLGLVNLPIMVAFLILLFFARDYKHALIENYINKHIQTKQRATVLSIQNLSFNIMYIFFVLVGGFFLDIFSLNTILVSFGIITFMTTMPYLILRYKNIKSS